MSGLSPDPASMKRYLDQWRDYADTLESQIEADAVQHGADLSQQRLRIVQLEQEMAAQATPFKAQIEALRSENELLRLKVREAERTAASALSRLAPLVDMNPDAKGTTLDTVIGQIAILVEEALAQFRESLGK